MQKRPCRDVDPVDLLLRLVRRRALLALLPAAAGCAAAQPPVSEPSVQPEPSKAEPGQACRDESGFPVQASGLRPKAPVDYVAVRVAQGGFEETGDAQAWTRSDFQVLSEAGRACAGATSEECKATVAHHPQRAVAATCLQMCSETSVVTTRGDEVKRWATPAELRELLGEIDSPDEALLLVSAEKYNVSCDPAHTLVTPAGDGYDVFATRMTAMCAPIIITGYDLHVSSHGEVNELATRELSRSEACVGRRPEGLHALTRTQHDAVADFLARSAHLEAASVHAFARLTDELAVHGAPAELIELSRRARADEIRHAEVMHALSAEQGADRLELELAAVAPRSLEETALENAVEGCVRETFGALVGAYQAQRATHTRLREAMTHIAEDELAHAALSHRVHAWAMSRLDAAGRARVRNAMREAIAALAHEQTAPLDAELAQFAGLPDARESSRVLEELTRGVWSRMVS